jgi:zinc transporter, ZIP family
MAVVDSLTGRNGFTNAWVGGGAVLALGVLSAFAVWGGHWKVLAISWVAFGAMAGAAVFGARAATRTSARSLVWGYGLASGAMITSAAMFLVPQAIGYDPRVGGLGIAFGVLSGFGAHTIGHRLSHLDTPFDTTAAEITAHALSAGVIIGLVYATLPELGLLLGLSIVSHKGPAGYAAARRLASNDTPVSVLLVPAAGVGLTAIPAAALSIPEIATTNALVFGFAAGVFLHVAMDFLPECETGSEIDEAAALAAETGAAHERLDRLRGHAVVSTGLGGVAVFLAWLAIGL